MLNVVVDDYSIRIGERFAVSFQRTLRIPDDGRTYPLPPGLGAFPILKVADHRDRVRSRWRRLGGTFISMYQREALWLGFRAADWKPNAVKVGVGGVNALSGDAFDDRLRPDPQDYLVCPDQPWLDGVNTGRGTIRQFVAMPLGLGYTVEEAVTGSGDSGGIEIIVFEPRPGLFPDEPPIQAETEPRRLARPEAAKPMGLGAGGTMRQKIYPDRHGIETWDSDHYGRVVIHIVNSAQFRDMTGVEPPPTPIDARKYTECGLPWFNLFDETKGDIAPTDRLSEVKTIAARDTERGEAPVDDVSVDVRETQIRTLGPDQPGPAPRQSPLPDETDHSPGGE